MSVYEKADGTAVLAGVEHTLKFLGTGAAGGVPSFFCTCAACLEAASEPRLQRTRSSVLISGKKNILVDAPPDLRRQLLAAGTRQIDGFILTHTHYDHSGGLGDIEFHARIDGLSPIPSYMSRESAVWLEQTFGFMADCLAVHVIETGEEFIVDDMTYTALEVTHSPGSFGLLAKTKHGRVAYIPDTGPLPPATLEAIRGVETLILGASFWGRNRLPEDHLSVEEALIIARDIRPEHFYLTHLSMHYDSPVTNHELESYLAPFGESFRIARDGLSIRI
ncbi:MAG TPA: MBL fold metallo-hydrolase [Syntrophorhabdales bacterium]|nr:MBL fold metallo-hydrolase [Syntrophorhabdales bacterium]